jgi:hypothetical protein
VVVAVVSLLVGAVFALSLPGTMLWQRVLQDAGHGPVFAGIAIALLLGQTTPAGAIERPGSAYRRAFLSATAIGVATELIQHWMPARSASWMDALHDAAGAAFGLALVWLVESRRAARRGAASNQSQRSSAVAIALLAFTVLAWQPLQCARAYAARKAALPALLPMGPVAEARFVQARQASVSHRRLPEQFRQTGDRDSIRLGYPSGARPGLRLVEPYPDWRNRDVLAIDITNPGAEPARFILRVFDAGHDWSHEDRFNQRIEIPAATRTTIRISLEAIATSPSRRRMNLGSVRDLMLFAPRPLSGGSFYVTRIWLE